MHDVGAVELDLQHLSTQAQGIARALYDRPARRGVTPHKQRDANDTFITDHGDFGRGAVLHYVQQRNDAIRWEIDMLKSDAWLIQHGPKLQGNAFQVGG